jgi:hypothetical protein
MRIAKFINSQEWETGDPYDLYIKLYKKVTSFDKHIGKRYNDLTGSHYFLAVYSLFYDGVLSTEDIARFDVTVQDELLRIRNTLMSND